MLRNDRIDPNRADRYQTRSNNMYTGSKYNQFATAQVGSQIRAHQRSQGMNESSQHEDMLNGAMGQEVKNVAVKTANKSIRVMRHEQQKKQIGNDPKKIPGGIQDEDSDEIILENILVDIVGQNIADKMPKNDPEYKNFKESYDRILSYFQERFKYISDELVLEIF
jgi:hypothetical protein